ncbi:TniQ family protein [Paraburkholderia sp. CNPSo 3281]|uniref:TniQ family protein n=1 Tax=Paraburkholderia sp. CNPSo 3281 TaxID=2940933 RepID=UPI0020B88411|nr:TniQ family protein [Paraburkholderia sp. CNPSo 3281]MCP3721068.1 TniQ family protein [Paraburkholderia sp. CNPSo 3281]
MLPQPKTNPCSVALLPGWLPNETIHSLACRYHLLASYQDPIVTARQLFRHAWAGNNPLFITGLDHFSSISQGMLGTCESIVLEHSPVPFFISFLKPPHRQRFISGFGQPGWKYWKSMLRGFYWPSGQFTRLRYCPICLKQDNANCGVGYWHNEHMLPATRICLLHECMLVAPTLLHRWSLPTANAFFSSDYDITIPTASAKPLLKKAAQVCNAMAATSPDCSNASTIRDVFARALKGMHVTGDPLNLHFHEQVTRLFLTYYAPIVDDQATFGLRLSSEELQIAIYRVLSAGPSYSPDVFCLLVAWLFGSWESFYYQYEQFNLEPAVRHRRGCSLHSLVPDEMPSTR